MVLALLFLSSLLLGPAWAQDGGVDCTEHPCAEVLPGAVTFEAVDDKPYVRGLDGQGEVVGWVILSDPLVDIVGYSGKPLITLIGLGPEGHIVGGKVVEHTEPILLVGIPDSALDAFVDAHVGLRADEPVTLGRSRGEGHHIDIVSGATVTVLAESRTILDTARLLAEDVGLLEVGAAVPGHWVVDEEPWSWRQMERRGVFGRLTVGPRDAGPSAQVDLWFTLADPPQVGRALLGDREYAWQMANLEEGERLFVVLNTGPGSFKGSGFVRGGLFDRIRLEQGLTTLLFSDKDYTNLPRIQAEGAPAFTEGGLFITRRPIDPGAPMRLVYLGSEHTLRGGFERTFHAFDGTWRAPRSLYALDGPDPEQAIWRSAWEMSWTTVIGVGLYLLAVMGLFIGRRWLTGDMARLERLHNGFLLVSFLVLGVGLAVQPSITQLQILVGAVVHGDWRWGLFLSEPLIFVSWIFIAVVTLVWGRGVFCGWVCPYGAMSELLFRVGGWLRLPRLELPDRIHLRARYLRYAVLAVLVVAFLVDVETGEVMAEIEPFKSTFFVPFWTRHVGFALWWLLLAGAALVVYRPFCRYLCPLGAGLALPSSIRASGPYRRDFCSLCKICGRGCESKAIRPDGTIDPRECLSCMECEANWQDDQTCPPLIKARRKREKAEKEGRAA